jgi:hypothetical protein
MVAVVMEKKKTFSESYTLSAHTFLRSTRFNTLHLYPNKPTPFGNKFLVWIIASGVAGLNPLGRNAIIDE